MDVPVWLYSLGFLPGLLFMRFFSLPSHPRFFSLRPFYLGRVLLISKIITRHTTGDNIQDGHIGDDIFVQYSALIYRAR